MNENREGKVKIIRFPKQPKHPFNHSPVKAFIGEHGGPDAFLNQPPMRVIVARNSQEQICAFSLNRWEESQNGRVISIGYTIRLWEDYLKDSDKAVLPLAKVA